jgi:hypothetical protein
MEKSCPHGRAAKASCPGCAPEQAFKRYQRAAKRRNLSFSLTLAEFEQLTQAACVFCGETPSLGIDRRDSRLGYYLQNSQSCCGSPLGGCNKLKSDLPEMIFLRQVLKIAQHQEKLKKQKLQPQIAA